MCKQMAAELAADVAPLFTQDDLACTQTPSVLGSYDDNFHDLSVKLQALVEFDKDFRSTATNALEGMHKINELWTEFNLKPDIKRRDVFRQALIRLQQDVIAQDVSVEGLIRESARVAKTCSQLQRSLSELQKCTMLLNGLMEKRARTAHEAAPAPLSSRASEQSKSSKRANSPTSRSPPSSRKVAQSQSRRAAAA
jgi:hypothetical protein